jgi:CheY-like chemotaxis protein
MGWDLAHRTDVGSAWDCVRESAPDLVLLDLNLPGQRGEELCRRLRSAPETARLPIALFVHWSCPQDVVSGLAAGANYVVAKDLLARPESWQARLREILANRDGLEPVVAVNYHHKAFLPGPPLKALEALNRALRHPPLRQLGPDVVRFVLCQAVTEVAGEDQCLWLDAGGVALDVGHVAQVASSDAVAAVAVAVAGQLQRLFGTEASKPVRDALREAIDCLGDDPVSP